MIKYLKLYTKPPHSAHSASLRPLRPTPPTITSQDRVVSQPPQIPGFEDTQKKLDSYGSDPEGIDRDRSSDAMYFDEFMALNQEEDNSDPNDGE